MQLKGTLYYYFASIKYSLMIFWMILGGVLVLSLGTEIIFGDQGTTVYFSFSAPVYIFAGIMGFWIVKNIIPYLIRMGSTRMNVFIATGISLTALVLFNALLSNTISSLVTGVFGDFSGGTFYVSGQEESVSFNHLGELIGAYSIWSHIIIDSSIQLFFMSISFLFGLIFYRYKLIGGGAVLGVLLFIFIYSASAGWITDFALNIINNFSFVFFYQLAGVAIIIYGASIFLLRRLKI